MKRLLRFAFCCAIAGLIAVSSAQAQAVAPRVLVAGIGLNADTPQGQGMARFAALVEQRSAGRIRVDVNAGATLGDDLKMINALRDGKQDITCPDSSTLARFVKGFSVINYPFTFLNEAETDAILDGPWGQALLSKLAQEKLVGLTFWENGFRHLTNSKRVLSNLGQAEGLRIRVMQNPMLIDSFNGLGFAAVPMPFSDVYQALSKRQVDGQENPLPTILSSRFYEVQSYLTLSRHVYSAFVFLFSKSTWDSFSAADQALLAAAARDAGTEQRRLNRAMTASALDQLRAKGMQVSVIGRREAESVRNRLHQVLDRYNRDVGEASVIDMYVALSQLRAKAATSEAPEGRPRAQ